MFILLLPILPLQINWDIRIHPLLYHWSALKPFGYMSQAALEGAAKWVIHLAKIQIQNEWIARGCKTSLQAGNGWGAGLKQVRSHQKSRWGCLLVFRQPQSIFSTARGKGPNPGRVQTVTLRTVRREFRQGLHEPSGGRKGQLRTNDSRSQVFQFG